MKRRLNSLGTANLQGFAWKRNVCFSVCVTVVVAIIIIIIIVVGAESP
jgi:hypothetical protein